MGGPRHSYKQSFEMNNSVKNLIVSQDPKYKMQVTPPGHLTSSQSTHILTQRMMINEAEMSPNSVVAEPGNGTPAPHSLQGTPLPHDPLTPFLDDPEAKQSQPVIPESPQTDDPDVIIDPAPDI